MEKLIIDRSKWRTGGDTGEHRTGVGRTRLLNDDGYMCCLGFACKQSGVTNEVLLNKATPSCISEELEENPDEYNKALLKSKLLAPRNEWLVRDSVLSDTAMSINDNLSLTRDEREWEIQELFGGHGIKVEFINEY